MKEVNITHFIVFATRLFICSLRNAEFLYRTSFSEKMLNFTVDPRFEWAFNCYLHGIGFVVLPLNLFTFYLIIAKTPKHSRSYRMYVLHMQVSHSTTCIISKTTIIADRYLHSFLQFWTTVLDLHVGLLCMPMPLFPLLGGYCNGLLSRAGLPAHYSVVSIQFSQTIWRKYFISSSYCTW